MACFRTRSLKSELDSVVSFMNGHQRGGGGHRSEYYEDRSKKLVEQRHESSASRILENVFVYIDGYLDDTTDIEMKRIVTLAGGQIMSAILFSGRVRLWLTVDSQARSCRFLHAHRHISAFERVQDAQDPHQEEQDQGPCREAGVGLGFS